MSDDLVIIDDLSGFGTHFQAHFANEDVCPACGQVNRFEYRQIVEIENSGVAQRILVCSACNQELIQTFLLSSIDFMTPTMMNGTRLWHHAFYPQPVDDAKEEDCEIEPVTNDN